MNIKQKLALFLIGTFLYPLGALAVTRTWLTSTSSQNWSVSSSWSGNLVPTSADVALFSASGTGNVTKNFNINVQGINIVSGYTGTISDSVIVTASSGPNSAGSFATSTNNSATGDWQSLTNASTSDDKYATSTNIVTTSTFYLVATNFGFAIPATSSVSGIVVEVERKKTGGTNVTDSSVKIVKNSVITGFEKASTTAWTTSDVIAPYGLGTTDLWGSVNENG